MKINVKLAAGLCVAEIEKKPHLYGIGRNIEEAIGKLVITHPDIFGVVIEGEGASLA